VEALEEVGCSGTVTSPIRAVKELFPDLGHAFVQACLRHFTSAEDTIHALLEDNLPSELASMDRTLDV